MLSSLLSSLLRSNKCQTCFFSRESPLGGLKTGWHHEARGVGWQTAGIRWGCVKWQTPWLLCHLVTKSLSGETSGRSLILAICEGFSSLPDQYAIGLPLGFARCRGACCCSEMHCVHSPALCSEITGIISELVKPAFLLRSDKPVLLSYNLPEHFILTVFTTYQPLGCRHQCLALRWCFSCLLFAVCCGLCSFQRVTVSIYIIVKWRFLASIWNWSCCFICCIVCLSFVK